MTSAADVVTLDDIRAAAARIRDHAIHTHSEVSRTLSEIAGARIVLKFENLQFTASFKDRGAANRLLTLGDDEKRRGVVAASAGNHAQAVAYHGGRLGIDTTIVMPETAPFSKVTHTEQLGARVVVSGETVSECADEARRLTEAEGFTFVHPYDDRAVIAGQGTCGLELGLDHPDLDVVVVPVGGGGLAAGVATAITSLLPGVEVIGVQTEAYPAMARVLAGEPIPEFPNETLADGIAVKRPGELTTPVLRERLTDMLVVGEEPIEHAVSLLAEVEKTVAEGAGAAALAGVLEHPDRFAGRSVGVIVSGGNIDTRVLASVLMRELVRTGRLLTLGITIKDRPGQLAPVIDRIAEMGANILEVSHSRVFDAASVRQTFIEVEIETRDRPHADAVIGALRDDGLEVKVMSR